MTPPPHDPSAAPDERWPDAAVLVVDDEPGMRHFLRRALASRMARVDEAGSAEEGATLLAARHYDLIVLDIALPGCSGIDWLKALRAAGQSCEVVLITAFADLDTAIEALRAGAGDLLLKPFRLPQVLNALRLAMERTRLRRENRLLRRALSARTPAADALVGRSIVVRGLQAALQRVAGVDSPVLLIGESGTGKELAATQLHRLSARHDGPFVAVACATADPAALEADLFGRPGDEGLIAAARGGTLFLDEVHELPLPLQAALVRALETRTVLSAGSAQAMPLHARIVAASHRPLLDEVRAGRFRDDLYYRLQVVELRLPPLRAHKEDIPDLVAHFVDTLAPRLGVPAIDVGTDEMAYLQQYDWPGNVRELRNLIERSLIVGALNVSALYQSLARREADAAPRAADTPPDLQTLERRHIQAVLDGVGGDKTRAARLLGISRRTLERRVAEWAHAGDR